MPNFFKFLVFIFLTSCMTVAKVNNFEQFSAAQSSEALVDLSWSGYNELIEKSDRPVLVKVYTTWCRVCEKIEGDFWRLGLQEKSKVHLARIDGEKYPQITKQFAISSYPYFILLSKKKPWFQGSGYGAFKVLERVIQKSKKIDYDFQYTRAKPSGDENYLLIAPGQQVANFGQEILELKRELLKQGVPSQNIACFYVAPNYVNFYFDRRQYRSLKKELSDCYRADVETIKSFVDRAARKKTKSVFTYISSHGFSPEIARQFFSGIAKSYKKASRKECMAISDYYLVLDRDFGERELYANHNEICSKNRTKTLMLSATTLKRLYNALPEATKKYFVLQGCFSGGFIRKELPNWPAVDNLTTLKNTIALTASRFDRTSFGCSAGDKKTFYGNAFLKHIKDEGLKNLASVDWPKLHAKILSTVNKQEVKLGIDLSERSEPQIYGVKN